MPCAWLYAACSDRRRSVSLMAGLHRIGHLLRIHDHPTVDVPGRSSGRLNQRSRRAQESLLVCVQNRDERHLRQVQPFTQQVDPDEHVESAPPQVAENLHTLQRLDIRVQVADLDAELLIVRRQVLRHPLGQRRHQHALPAFGARPDFVQQVVHLPAYRAHLDWRIHEARRPNHLFHDHPARLGQLVGPWRGGDEDHLLDSLLPLREVERPVVQRGRQAEAVGDEHFLPRAIAVVHPANLRHSLMALVDDDDRIVREIVEQRRRRFTGRASGEVPGVVLDAVAVADLANHLEIEHRALVQPLCLEQFALRLEQRRGTTRAPA